MRESEGSARGPEAPIAWRRLGAGPPLLMLNGYAATKDDWDPGFLERLGGFSELLCPDNRGVGASGPAGDGLTVASMATDALAVLDELGIERAPVLGWSMGGFVAQELAARAPERVEALILLSTDAGARALPADPQRWAALTDHSGTAREQARRLIGLLFPEPVAREVDERFGELVAEARAQLSPETLALQESAMERWHREPADHRLAAIAAPALCAAGAEDAVIPPGNAELLAGSLPDAWRASFPGGGHAFMAQEPARLAGLIRVFLDR